LLLHCSQHDDPRYEIAVVNIVTRTAEAGYQNLASTLDQYAATRDMRIFDRALPRSVTHFHRGEVQA
jgi:hypothetical protein